MRFGRITGRVAEVQVAEDDLDSFATLTLEDVAAVDVARVVIGVARRREGPVLPLSTAELRQTAGRWARVR